jgi:hypothetical protein
MTKVLIVFAGFVAALSSVASAQSISSITPPQQRVYDHIEIRGSGFGSSQGSSEVRFSAGATTIEGHMAYVWRDD